MTLTDEQLAEALDREMVERERVSKLTNQQLADELLQQLPFTEFDSLIEEAATRIDPTWEQRAYDTPLTESDERVLAKALEHFNKRMDEIEAARAAQETPAVPHGHFWRGDIDPAECRHCRNPHSAHLHTDEASLCPTGNR